MLATSKLSISSEISQTCLKKNSTGVIPLVQAWSQLYADSSASAPFPTPPFLQTFDFERLYTNIGSQDMQTSIMHMVQEIFDVKAKKGFVASRYVLNTMLSG